MATWTPKELIQPAALTTSLVTLYTATGVTGVIRTIQFMITGTSGVTVSLYRETNRPYFDATQIVRDYATIWNGIIVIPDTKLVKGSASSISPNAPNCGAWGYEYV